MSYPRLVLSGSTREITAINVSYENDKAGSVKPAQLKRLSYDVRRETRLDNVSGGTPNRFPEMNYNKIRLHHTWVGYLDVLTESVVYYVGCPAATTNNVTLMDQAIMFNDATGIRQSIGTWSAGNADLAPHSPSLGYTYSEGIAIPYNWYYKTVKVGLVYNYSEVAKWMIRDIRQDDRGNNVTRVTFTFEIIEPWLDLGTIVDGLS